MSGTEQKLTAGKDRPDDGGSAGAETSAARPQVAPLEADASKAVARGSEHAPARVETGTVAVPLEMASAPKRFRRLKRFAALVVLLGALSYGGKYGHEWLVHGQFVVSTDDAYVRAETSIIAPKVSGYAVAVVVADNAQVKAGDLLVRIDPEDYEIAIDAAKGKIATQDATIARIGRQIEAQKAVVAKARAQLAAARADAERVVADLDRIERLAARSFSSRKALDAARAARARASASVISAEAEIAAAEANVEVLAAQREEARRLNAEYRTVLRKAQRDLQSTKVRAPFDGVVGNLAVKEGQLVQPGTRLLALVPLDRIYVEANFKETHIGGLKVGQSVAVSVDAYRDDPIVGRIESIAPAAGSEFSLLPPENATGNFTKIVQRVPVRISVPANVAVEGRLRPGLSVVVSVDTLDPDLPRPTLLGLLGWDPIGAATTPPK